MATLNQLQCFSLTSSTITNSNKSPATTPFSLLPQSQRTQPSLLILRRGGRSKTLPVTRLSLGLAGYTFSRNNNNNQLLVSFAASHPESKPSEVKIDAEENDLKQAGQGSQEAWKQTLASFKEQALRLQSVSQEAYEEYCRKADVILKKTAEQLKIQADQAKQDLAIIAIELSEDGREYLTTAAENAPEPVKDVVETFASADDLDDVSKVRDFYVGVPYGTILSLGGFLNFMLTGSISAIRFGVILGGVLLALSVSSLRAWKKGQATDITLKGQAAVVGILFLRDIRLVFQGFTFAGLIKTIISGAVAAFYMYRITSDKGQKQPNVDWEAQS